MRTPLILALLLAPAPAPAQETLASAQAKYHAEFQATDADGSGALSPAEVQARIGRMKAGRGRIDPTHAKRLADLWFGRADANGDGKVTEAEGQALLAATFKRYDANGDGRVGGAPKPSAGR